MPKQVLKAVYFDDCSAMPIWKKPELKSMDDIKFGDLFVNDSVSSCKSGIAYLNSCVCELRYLKSQQNT